MPRRRKRRRLTAIKRFARASLRADWPARTSCRTTPPLLRMPSRSCRNLIRITRAWTSLPLRQTHSSQKWLHSCEFAFVFNQPNKMQSQMAARWRKEGARSTNNRRQSLLLRRPWRCVDMAQAKTVPFSQADRCSRPRRVFLESQSSEGKWTKEELRQASPQTENACTPGNLEVGE